MSGILPQRRRMVVHSSGRWPASASAERSCGWRGRVGQSRSRPLPCLGVADHRMTATRAPDAGPTELLIEEAPENPRCDEAELTSPQPTNQNIHLGRVAQLV